MKKLLDIKTSLILRNPTFLNMVEAEKNEVEQNTVLSKKKLTKFNEKIAKRGIVYLSRVPPFMKPEKVRHLMSKFGDVNRIYLVPEDKTQRKKRLKSGGNKKIYYTEGWIEFEDRKIAKNVASMLNLKIIGGKKRDFYHDDMWNLKYLKGFKWDHLTEKIAYENRVRDQKLRMEVAQAKKENAVFLDRVDQSKSIEKMEQRKIAENADHRSSEALNQVRRKFKQKEPIKKDVSNSRSAEIASGLKKAFASKKRKLEE